MVGTTFPLQLPWVIYALGQGKDALSRALAIAQLAAQHRQVVILSNSSYAASAQDQILQDAALKEQVSIQRMPFVENAAARAEALLQIGQLCSVSPFVLIVDAPPTGFYSELADILSALSSLPKILVLRDFKLADAIAYDLENLIETHYDLAIIPGAHEAPATLELFNAKQTNPWLSQPASGHRQKARDLMGLSEAEESAPTILVLASDEAAEMSVYGYIAATLAQHRPDAKVKCLCRLPPDHCPVEIWENQQLAIDYLPGVDLVIGSGDYGTVYACQAFDIPLIAFPWTRADDLQRERLDRAIALGKNPIEIVTSAEEAVASAFIFLNQRMENGASQKQASSRQQTVPEQAGDESSMMDGTGSAIALIEAAIVTKWNQTAQAAMAAEVNQLRARRTERDQESW
ncbi:MAG: hypothetical protein WA885_18845 [Phormidesmis sp.]